MGRKEAFGLIFETFLTVLSILRRINEIASLPFRCTSGKYDKRVIDLDERPDWNHGKQWKKRTAPLTRNVIRSKISEKPVRRIDRV